MGRSTIMKREQSFVELANGAVFWAVISGLLGAALLMLHVAILAPFELLAATQPHFLVLQIAAVSILQSAGLLLSLAMVGWLITRAGKRAPYGLRLATAVRSSGLCAAILPAAFCWVVFGLWNGRVDAVVWVMAILLCIVVVGVSILGARAVGARHGHRFRLSGAAYAALLVAAGIMTLRVVAPELPRPGHAGQTLLREGKRSEKRGPTRTRRSRAGTVVLLTIDTLRADHLGCYGYERDTSPNIDLLASRGVLFENMIAAASGTVPSMATLLSGIEPVCHGVSDQGGILAASIPAMADRFKKAGYRTFAVVGNQLLSEGSGFAQGFDTYDHETARPLQAAEVVRKVEDVLEAAGRDPMFMWIHLMDPHPPYNPPPELYSDFLNDAFYEVSALPLIQYGSVGGANIRRLLGSEEPWSRPFVDEGYLTARYDGAIRVADWGVGKVLGLLEDAARAEDTVLFLVADHGETFRRGPSDVVYQHALQVHQSDVHVPAILWAPGRVAQGHRVAQLARHVDVLPTVLSIAGLAHGEAHEVLAGRDLLEPGARQGQNSGPAVAQTAWWDGLSLKLLPLERRRPAYALVEDGGWKYIRHPHSDLFFVRGWRGWMHAWRSIVTGAWCPDELYDLRRDASERANLIQKYPERAQRMREAIGRYLSTAEDARCRQYEVAHLDEQALRHPLEVLGYLD